MTSLELRALELFGKVPATAPPEHISIHFKSEKEEDEEEMEHIPTTETFQKQLQAAVEYGLNKLRMMNPNVLKVVQINPMHRMTSYGEKSLGKESIFSFDLLSEIDKTVRLEDDT